MYPALLTARFALELALLAGLAVGGWHLAEDTWGKALLAVALPLAAATLWGLFVAPKARLVVPLPARLVVEVMLFGSAAVVLWLTGFTELAVSLVALEAVVLVALLATGHPPGPQTPRGAEPR